MWNRFASITLILSYNCIIFITFVFDESLQWFSGGLRDGIRVCNTEWSEWRTQRKYTSPTIESQPFQLHWSSQSDLCLQAHLVNCFYYYFRLITIIICSPISSLSCVCVFCVRINFVWEFSDTRKVQKEIIKYLWFVSTNVLEDVMRIIYNNLELGNLLMS